MKRGFLIVGILLTLLGLIMLFAPTEFISVLVVCIGVITIINGISSLINMRNMVYDTNLKRTFTIRAVLNIVIGLAAVILPLSFAGIIWTIIIYVLAVQLLISSILEIYGVWKMKDSGVQYGEYLIEAIVSIILAVVLFMIPASIGITLIRIIGILIAVAGVGCIVWDQRLSKKKLD